MRLTKQSNYAVRALVYCAVNDPHLSRVSDIAKSYAISEMFLFKLIKPLVGSGMIETTRGRNGGIRLAKPASNITILEAIQASEDFKLTESFADASQELVAEQEFNALLKEALNSFFEVLQGYTIADLITNGSQIRDVLGIRSDQPEH